MSLFPPVRRIITSHAPTSDASEAETEVLVHLKDVHPKPLQTPDNPSASEAYIGSLWTNTHPAINTYSYESDEAEKAQGRLVIPGGSNVQVTDIAPNVSVGMHRTPSVDYNIIILGQAILITPDGKGGVRETNMGPGDIVIQRGTLHAWRAGPEGVRWITVLVHAERVKGPDGRELADVEL